MSVINVSEATFESEVLDSDLPVLIDFYADWCGPCKTIAPHIEALAKEHAGNLKVVKVDVDNAPRVAQAFQVQSIPTIALVQNKQLVDRLTGAVPRKQLDEMVSKVVSGSAVESWDPDRVKLAVEAELAVAVDLRVESDYLRAHLPGAVNIPPEGRADRLAELEGGVRYIFYARTDEGVADVARLAANAGHSTAVLDGGLLGWEANLFPVEKGEPS